MAAGLFAHRVRAYPHPPSVASAGLGAVVGAPADRHTLILLRERGIDWTHHRAQQLTPALVAAHDLVLVMDEEQREEVEQLYPPAIGRVWRIGHHGGFDIPDPYRQPRAAFQFTLDLIERGLADFERARWTVK
jgi:protein-tyrosine phosphatase